MKKSFLFAAVIAMVAMVATSCDKKPKADFRYDDDGLTVSFTNKSTNADVYAWDFGDGQTSTEANPVHQYAEAKTYTVKLTASNSSASDVMTRDITVSGSSTKAITIDGKFDDWAAMPAERLAVAEADENTAYEYLYKLMLAQDANYIYFYAEFSAEEDDFVVEGETVHGYNVEWLDFYLNLDDDASTGSNSYLFVNSAAEWLIEGQWANYSEAKLIPFDPEAAQDAWGWLDEQATLGAITGSDASILENGHRAFEGKITKGMVQGDVVSVRAGLFTSNTGWGESGCLPQVTIMDDGTSQPSELLLVPAAE